MKTRRKILITVGIAVGILILTNPTMQDFKNYSGRGDIKREMNFLVFSIYSFDKNMSQLTRDERIHSRFKARYLGIAKNFIYLN